MVVVESKREQCVLNLLVEQVGHEGVAEACAKLAGERRTYPSNVTKVSELVPPQRLAVAARADASTHLEEIADLLRVRSCT